MYVWRNNPSLSLSPPFLVCLSPIPCLSIPRAGPRARSASLSNHSHTDSHPHFRRHWYHQGRRGGHQVRLGKIRASVQVGHLAQDLGRHQVAPLRGHAPQLDVVKRCVSNGRCRTSSDVEDLSLLVGSFSTRARVGGAGELVMPKEGVCDVNHEYRVADYLRDVGALWWCFLVFADVSSLLCLPMLACVACLWRGSCLSTFVPVVHAYALFEIQQ